MIEQSFYFRECVRAFIESACEWDLFEAMNTNIQHSAEENDLPEFSTRVTPMRLLIKRFPDLAKLVLDRCLTTNRAIPGELRRGTFYKLVTPDHEDFTIVLRYGNNYP